MPVIFTALCPRCHRSAKLHERFEYRVGARSVHHFKFECRKWFGLRLCFGPQQWHVIEKGWGDLGVQEAARKWNEAVDKERNDVRDRQ